MPGEVFVDTSAWYPAVVRNHPDHAPLAAALHEAVADGQRLVTTNLVVAETHALLLCRVHRAAALAFVRAVDQPPNLLIRSTAELEHAARADWLDRYDDQDFSFTDAVSFAVMSERGIASAVALDRHFRAAGFEVFPGES